MAAQKAIHLIIFGATGDLALRKLFPALLQLKQRNHLPPVFSVLAIGRRPWNTEQFRQWLLENIPDYGGAGMDALLSGIHYFGMKFDDPSAYRALEGWMQSREAAMGGQWHRVCYLATAPEFFPVISENLGQLRRGSEPFGTLMIEKPFGYDLKSAQEFNRSLQRCFPEKSICRIDHYLGKEMMRNILVFRFANRLFEPVWNRHHIDHIQITASETIGVEQRGSYYDHSGALRDMVQNHLLQMLALTAMDRPLSGETEAIRDSKVKLLDRLVPFKNTERSTQLILGQYQGSEEGLEYRAEPGVSPHSETESYVALRVQIDNDRWRGVPFFLRTGKRLKERSTKITVVFKPETGIFGESTQPNCLVFRIQPEEGVDLRYNSKMPGTLQEIDQVSMNYCQSCNFPGQSPEAYEKLLYDAFAGDLSLFTRWDEIEASWRFVDSVRKRDIDENPTIHGYRPGSWGPDASEEWIRKQGYQWLDL